MGGDGLLKCSSPSLMWMLRCSILVLSFGYGLVVTLFVLILIIYTSFRVLLYDLNSTHLNLVIISLALIVRVVWNLIDICYKYGDDLLRVVYYPSFDEKTLWQNLKIRRVCRRTSFFPDTTE